MENTSRNNKKTFKQTKDLINLAVKDGWTQKEIADACRTQQSVVSSWKKGTKLGTEQQLTPLLKQYGAKIRRQSFKVYWGIDEETGKQKYFKVEGPVILSFLNCQQRIYKRDGGSFSDVPGKFYKSDHPEHERYILQFQGQDQYTLIIQKQITIDHTPGNYHENEGVWVSTVMPPLSPQQLIKVIDEHIKNKETTSIGHRGNITFNSYLATLPYLIRQALLNNGVSIEEINNGDIEVVSAQW